MYLSALADLFFRRCCTGCGRTLLMGEKYLCLHCEADFPRTRFAAKGLSVCRNKMADDFNCLIQRMRDSSGREGYIPYISAAALFYYRRESAFRNICRSLKYGGDIPQGRYFAARLAAEIASCAAFEGVTAVVPVPLHWMRRYRRGYNQAEVIAREIARQLPGAKMFKVLRRTRRTASQTGFDPAGRLQNVNGAFEVRSRAFRDLIDHAGDHPHILLVDDVFTTGATLAACYMALEDALEAAFKAAPEEAFKAAQESAFEAAQKGALHPQCLDTDADRPVISSKPWRISIATLGYAGEG